MEARPCPVCPKGKVWRRHVRTCSRHCSMIWNTWSPDIQARAVELAGNSKELINIDEIQPGTPETKPSFLK